MKISRVLTGAAMLGAMVSVVAAPVALAADVTPTPSVKVTTDAPKETTVSPRPTVSGSKQAPSTSSAPDGTPKGAPQTGGGGTADDGSGNLGLIALGGAVVVGGAGVGVMALRRRSSQG